MRILVTGATGLIGSNLCKALNKKYLTEGISTSDGDLTDFEFCNDVLNAFPSFDVVFHCAAVTSGAKIMEDSPLSHITPNIVMNANLMEANFTSSNMTNANFDGANLNHGNKTNKTGKTRMSIDFRIFARRYYKSDIQEAKETITQKKKLIIGDYWAEI